MASALLQDLEAPSRLSRLALTLKHTLAIGEDGALRIWDAECKLRRVNFGRKLIAIDICDDALLLGVAPRTVCIGRIDSSMHNFQEVELPNTTDFVHAVRIVECTEDGLRIVACAGDKVFLLQMHRNGEVHAVCSRPFQGHPVAAIRAVEKDDKMILLAASPVHGRLSIAHAGLQRGFPALEPWSQLATWEGHAAHVHGVVNVLDIDSKGKVFVECDDCALAVVDGFTGRTFCHDLVCGGTGGLPGGIGCLFDHGGTTLIFWSSANLPELAVSHIAKDEALVIWQGASETLGSPLFPHMVSTTGSVGFIWSDATNTQHAVVIQEYDPSASPSATSSSTTDSNLMNWDNFDKNQQRELPVIASTSDAADDFYRPGVSDQNRPLDDVIEELQEYTEDDGNAKSAEEIICYRCETGSDDVSSQE